MTLDASENYDVRINNLDGDFTASLIEAFRFWTPDPFGDSFNLETKNVPHRHGGIIVGDGMKDSKIITVEGLYTSLVGNANAAYGGLMIQGVERLFEEFDRYGNEGLFLDIQNRTGAATSATRRLFVSLLRRKFNPDKGSQYTQGGVKLTFEASDPEFYDDTVQQSTGSGSSHTLALYPSPGTRPTQRFTVKIENTDGNALTDPSMSVTGGASWTVEETISGSGDYIEVDHLNGTVIKNVSGTETDIIDKFSGSFFELPHTLAVCTITVDTGDTGVFDGTIDYWKKAGYAIA